MSLDRVVTEAQNGRHALAGGHQVGVQHTDARPPGGVQHCRYFRLHRDGPIAVARREAAREVLFLPRGPLPQLGFGGIRRLLRQGGTQRVRRHGGGNIPHPGPADLCIHAGAQSNCQHQCLRAALQMLHHIPALQDPCFQQAVHIGFQPDGPGRGGCQNGHRAFFQQCPSGRVRLPPGAKVARRLRDINLGRFFQHQRPAWPDGHFRRPLSVESVSVYRTGGILSIPQTEKHPCTRGAEVFCIRYQNLIFHTWSVRNTPLA